MLAWLYSVNRSYPTRISSSTVLTDDATMSHAKCPLRRLPSLGHMS